MAMRAPLIFLFLAAGPAASQVPEEPADIAGAPARPSETLGPELGLCLGSQRGVREFYHALTAAEKVSFNALYAAFRDNVALRNSQGWTHDWAGNFWTNTRNGIIDHGWLKGLVKPSLSWAESRRALEASAARLAEHALPEAEAAAAADPGSRSKANHLRLLREQHEDLQKMLRHGFGTCGDWALDTYDAVLRVPQEHFSIEKRGMILNARLGDSGAHAFVRVCRKSGGSPCIVLDAWKRGLPELVTDAEIAKGPSKADSCFSRNRP